MKDSELRMIETMLKKQDELNSAIMKEFGLTTISKEQIDLATLDEIGEFTHELKGDWCWWKKSQEPVDRNKALEELADVFHFVLIYELLYGKRTYLLDDLGYDLESPRDYMPMVQMDIGLGIATALTRIIDLADSRLMYLLALSEHLGFCLEEVYAAYMRKNAINMFKEGVNLLTGLINEHFEEKAETNLEHFKDAIIDNEFNFAVKNGKVEPCGSFRCDECSLDDNDISCCEMRVKWLLRKYEKQKYKLSQFEYDLLNAYKVSGMLKSIRNYSALFELYEKGYFKDVDLKATIVEILDNCEVIQ